jgi:putative membrane protein
MDFMYKAGILGTRAPLFMDIVTIIVSVLPLLMVSIIYLAAIKKYKLHILLQKVLFVVTVLVLTYFETGVRVSGGFNAFMDGSGVEHNYAFIVLVFHIAISVITLIVWITTLLMAKKQLKLKKHKRAGRVTLFGVVLTSLTGIWVYLLMFVY